MLNALPTVLPMPVIAFPAPLLKPPLIAEFAIPPIVLASPPTSPIESSFNPKPFPKPVFCIPSSPKVGDRLLRAPARL